MTHGETDLKILLKEMNPQLNEGEYVFCCVEEVPTTANIVMSFKEQEGITIIITKQDADSLKLEYTSIMSWITLHIHSSLEAIGLTAAFAKALGEKNISCNVVAGFYHDHIFVGKGDSKRAMEVLRNL